MSAETGPAAARRFLFVLHCHQPPGNLPAVFDEAYARCYLPLLDSFARFPEVKVCLHVSGALLEHAVHHRPELIDKLAARVRAGQVELLGGGFYEPVLSALPDADAQGQLEMMSLLLDKHFGARPRGAWLTERVWDPELPRLLAPAGLGYTFVDAQNLQVGLPEGEAVDGYWVTHRAGHLTALFAVDRGLRYRIPGDEPAAIFEAIRNAPGDDVVTFADDGEKLGLWPGSHGWVFERGWLERFLGALTEAQAKGEVQTVLPTAHLESTPPRGRVHVPSGSYSELSRWALPASRAARFSRIEDKVGEADADRAFLRGGSWSDFLVHLPEAGRQYGRMIAVSERLQDVLQDTAAEHGGMVPTRLADRLGTAQRALYRAQGADAYWRGLFAGAYMDFLRADVAKSLIDADAILDRVQQGEDEWVAFEERDLDLDGELEVALVNRDLAVHVRPQGGGGLLAIEDRVRGRSLLDVVAPGLGTEGDAAMPRVAFVDAIGAGEGEAELDHGRFRVEALEVDEGDEVAARVQLTAERAVHGAAVTVSKTYRLDLEGAHLSVTYGLLDAAEAPRPLTLRTALPLALSMQARLRASSDGAWVLIEGTHDVTGELVIEDLTQGVRLTLDVSRPLQLSAKAVYATVRTPAGVERLWQGYDLTLAFSLQANPEEPARVELGLDVAAAEAEEGGA